MKTKSSKTKWQWNAKVNLFRISQTKNNINPAKHHNPTCDWIMKVFVTGHSHNGAAPSTRRLWLCGVNVMVIFSPFCIRTRNSIVANRAGSHTNRLAFVWPVVCAVGSFVVCSITFAEDNSEQLNKSHHEKKIFDFMIFVEPIRIHSTPSLTDLLQIWFEIDWMWADGARSRCMRCGQAKCKRYHRILISQ